MLSLRFYYSAVYESISKEVRIAGTAKVHLSSLMYFKWVWKALQETTFSYTCSMISTFHFALDASLATSMETRPVQPKKKRNLFLVMQNIAWVVATHTNTHMYTYACVLPLVHIDWLISNYKSWQIGNGLQRDEALQLLHLLTFEAINL